MSVNVDIDLNGKTYTLRPSLGAAKTVNGLHGGFVGVYAALQRFDMTTFAAVICAGTGTKKPDSVAEVEEAVWQAGLEPLLPPLSRYVTILMNGGREPIARDDDEKQGGEAKNS